MSVPTISHKNFVDSNVPVPMRDGTLLRADVYRPDGDGQWPVILYRFVMDPTGIDEFAEMGTYFSQHGYVFIYNDVRGCGRSNGDFFPLVDEAWGEN